MFCLILINGSKYTILFLLTQGAVFDNTFLNISNSRFRILWCVYSKSANNLSSFS